MSGDRDTQTTRPRRWIRLGLLLVGLLLGHGALMAMETSAAPHPAIEAIPHADPTHEQSAASFPVSTAPLESEHPEQCGVSLTALLRSPDEVAHVALAVVLAGWRLDWAASPREPATMLVWEEPRWPPGTRRALWQVYRI